MGARIREKFEEEGGREEIVACDMMRVSIIWNMNHEMRKKSRRKSIKC